MTLYDSIIPCFGSRFTVVMMPEARRYRVFPLGTFHYFDWQKTDKVGVSIGTCPQIVSSETAQIGIQIGDRRRILPFGEGDVFANVKQHITPLTTVFEVSEPALPVEAKFTFRSAFYPQSFEYSCPPGYIVEATIRNSSNETVYGNAFFGVPLKTSDIVSSYGVRSVMPLAIPDGIDHDGIENLIFSQTVETDTDTPFLDNNADTSIVGGQFVLHPNEEKTINFYHVGYIYEPTLNVRGRLLKFGYTTLWDNYVDVAEWLKRNRETIIHKGDIFEATILEASVAPELKDILSASFKGLASNAWWTEDDWFSVMEIGAYHSTLDVDYQLALFFFQYWPELIKRMLNQWTDFYKPKSGYMAHDVGQHLEATGNRYGGSDSAMKVEENCNYLILLHHYWRSTGDDKLLAEKHELSKELVDFLIAADTTESGLPNRDADNTNDWGSGLIMASEEQSYHGVRLVVAYSAVGQIADYLNDDILKKQCLGQIERINGTLEKGWLGDHYPISFADEASFHHYSMWTTHGLLYALRNGMKIDINLEKLRIDLISSTRRTMREHGCVHSTADVRGWLTQNLWRDSIAAYLGVDMTDNFRRYLGHGEYMSYEDTTILEVANELMVVSGAVADHTYAGETHDFPMVDGHPRPACAFGLPYALAGVQFDWIEKRISFNPVVFPLRIALTHLADWKNERVPIVSFRRSTPNWDKDVQPISINYTIENEDLLDGWKLNY